MPNTTFVTPLEVVRYIHRFCDFSNNEGKKQLDDRIKNIDLLQSHLDETISKFVIIPLKTVISPNVLNLVEKEIKDSLKFYIEHIVREIQVDGLHRNSVNKLLMKYYVAPRLFLLLKKISENHYKLNSVDELFQKDSRSVSLVMREVKQDLSWMAYLNHSLKNTKGNKFSRWESGEYLPSFQEIKLIGNGKYFSEIKLWLIIARVLDSIRKTEFSEDFFSTNYKKDFDVKFFDEQIALAQKQQVAQDHFSRKNYNILLNGLSSRKRMSIEKITEEKIIEYQKTLDETYQLLNQCGCLEFQKYHWDKFQARLFLIQGRLDKAVESYEKSFENAIFKAGKSLKDLIQECIVVTAFYEKTYNKPKKKFLTHLKHAMILFKFELPSINKEIKKLNHSDVIEDWEIDLWARAFNRMFSPDFFLPSVSFPVLENRMIALRDINYDDFEPDYSDPNKEFSLNNVKKMPQIVFFAMMNKNDIVETLLKLGADPNKLSSCNESAISLALESLVLDEKNRSRNLELFNLLSQCKYSVDVINTKWSKTQQFPLLLAVKSGNFQVVKQVLELGADPDLHNEIDQLTPLRFVINQISFLRDPKRHLCLVMGSSDLNRMDVQEWRKRNTSFSPFYLNMPEQSYDERLAFFTTLFSEEYEKWVKFSSIDELYRIAEILLEKGVNPNKEYDINDLEGFTPLMLAVEHNDKRMFELMLKFGGDINRPCFSKGKLYYLQDIKKNWNSEDIPI